MAGPQEEAEPMIRKSSSYEMGEMSRDDEPIMKTPQSTTSRHIQAVKKALFLAIFIVVAYCSFNMIYESITGGPTCEAKPAKHSKVPDYFDPNPELWPGPTATGRAPFLAQETIVPTLGPPPNKTMMRLWGHLSPYSPNYEGWGVDEYPLPEGAEITQVHVRPRFIRGLRCTCKLTIYRRCIGMAQDIQLSGLMSKDSVLR